MKIKSVWILVVSIFLIGCKEKQSIKKNTLFTSLSGVDTGIVFKNNLLENDSLNYFNYSSIYMGGGVSVGDINNDGMIDVFFTGNQVKNRLYLNKGNLQFEDITDQSGISGDDRWYTGSTMGDVNGDGFLDIYCSVAGLFGAKNNQLFINNGDNTFSEKAKEFGVDDGANSVQATFFDYDNDGDLDIYVANYPRAHVSTQVIIYKQRMKEAKLETSDKLYRNDGNLFTDVTGKSGIKNYGFSLSATIGDINNDGWQDIYVSNDYSIPDYFYINNGDGTFKEVIKEATGQTSFYGMGVDISDINNDGFLDIFQVDMDSESNRRQKANMMSMNISLFREIVMSGFHYQYMHNCMQLNTGITNNGIPYFSNVSRLMGVSSTDWSWGPLFADFDNDGNKDLFVTNGTRKEINNRDFFNEIRKPKYSSLSKLEKSNMLPVEKVDNFIFRNTGNLKFEKANVNWGVSYKGFSHGLAYADLDNDGDLEIITNNMDDYASIFENTSSEDMNYLTVTFKGEGGNLFGLGNRVYLQSNGKMQMQELTLSRGFQSSVAPELHFGLNQSKKIEELKVVWTDGKSQTLKNIDANQKLQLSYSDAVETADTIIKKNPTLFITEETEIFPEHKHKENQYDDFFKQVLLPHKMSAFGPALAVGDLNNDGLDDYYVGGAAGYSGAVFYQSATGFTKKELNVLTQDKDHEDMGAVIFDADQDGDQDLYVVSGGYEFTPRSKMLQDRLYINDGKGQFSKVAETALPEMLTSGSRVYHADFDKDGKEDLLVLGRQDPGNYPAPVDSYILKNISENNKAKFENVTTSWIKEFAGLGMATSAVITDFDNDGWSDIIVVGEWMPIRIFKNIKTGFAEVSEAMGLTSDTTGWWWSIAQGDFDNDGDMDYLLGNNGLNYKYKATEEETFDIYVDDFDKNNKKDIVLSYYSEGTQVPVRGRECSSQQIPAIKNKFKDYKGFSEATLADVYTKKSLESALHYQVKSFASVYMENTETGFKIHELPIQAQLSSINQILVDDFDADGNLDALVAGNLYASEVETPRNDAGYGLFLKGDGKGGFRPLTIMQSGLFIQGDVKDLAAISIKGSRYIIAGKNNDSLQFVKLNPDHKLGFRDEK